MSLKSEFIDVIKSAPSHRSFVYEVKYRIKIFNFSLKHFYMANI